MLKNAETATNILVAQMARELTQPNTVMGEAVEAKAEWIENEIQEGRTVEGNNLQTVLEEVLVDGIEAVKQCYLQQQPHFINVLVDSEIKRIADKLAPALVEQHLTEQVA